jgi:hypothetical protein
MTTLRASLAVAVAVALASGACGGGNDPLSDAPPGDDGGDAADASPPDAAPTTVTLHVSYEDFDPFAGEPVDGARIRVIAPDDGTADYTTDASGSATFPVTAGSRIWVVREGLPVPSLVPGGGPPGYIYLLEDIGPGATIRLGAAERTADSVAGQTTVSFTPWDGTYADSVHDGYLVSPDGFSCTDAGIELEPGSILFSVYDGCSTATREMVVTNLDALGNPIAWLRVPGFGPITTPVDGTAAVWDDTGTTYEVTSTGLPSNVVEVSADFRSALSWHRTYVSGSPRKPFSIVDAALPTPASATYALSHDAALPQWLVEPLAALASSYTIDGDRALPFVDTIDYNPSNRTVSWTEVDAGTALPALVTTSFNYYDDVDFSQYRWVIYAPGGWTELPIPDVPDDLTTHDLQAGDPVYPDVWLVDVEGASYGSILGSVDLYRTALDSGFQPAARAAVSGGFPFDK